MHTKPRQVTALAVTLLVSASLLIGTQAAARAQEPAAAATQERERGIELYRQGNIKAAVQVLRDAVKQDKTDADAWYFLSLALNRDGDTKDARKAVEKSVKLRPNFAPARAGLAYFLLLSNKLRDAMSEAEATLALDPKNAEAHYVASVVHLRQDAPDKALESIQAVLAVKPDFAPALLWKSQVLLGLYSLRTNYLENETPEARAERTKGNSELLKEAADSLEKYLQLSPSPPKEDVWRAQLATLRTFSQNAKNVPADEGTVYDTSQVTTKARILTRPEPQYTEEARKHGVSGAVVMRGIFAADGTVQHILVLRSLPYGLTEMSVKAARRIKFVPATKDGRPVSQFIQIEYNFNLY